MSKFAQHHPTIPNITQQCPTWVAKRSQHSYPTLLAFVGLKCWHRLSRALREVLLIIQMLSFVKEGCCQQQISTVSLTDLKLLIERKLMNTYD